MGGRLRSFRQIHSFKQLSALTSLALLLVFVLVFVKLLGTCGVLGLMLDIHRLWIEPVSLFMEIPLG